MIFVVMFAALSLGGTDSFIAKYNVDRYLDGDTESIDIDALVDLGDAGVPQLVRLAEYFDEKNGTDISDYNAALEYATDAENKSWSSYLSLVHALYDAIHLSGVVSVNNSVRNPIQAFISIRVVCKNFDAVYFRHYKDAFHVERILIRQLPDFYNIRIKIRGAAVFNNIVFFYGDGNKFV